MHNPFAPPHAEVADIQSAPNAEPPYFSVSLLKLAVLSVCTAGFYELYWFYRQWRAIKRREGGDAWPFWRAFFAVLFCYPCFKRIRQAEMEMQLQPELAAGALATGWIVLTICWKLPDPFWLLSYLAVIFLLPVQSHIVEVSGGLKRAKRALGCPLD